MDNENRMLYPMKFIPVPGLRDWGGNAMLTSFGKKLCVPDGRRERVLTADDRVGECYDVADLGYIDSMIDNGWFGGNTLSELMNTYLERVTGERAFNWYGTQFPVTVKWIDARDRMPLRVNPDDDTAAQRYDAFGKTALWYVAEAGEDAALYLGFASEVSASDFYAKCNDGSVDELLNVVRPKKGDSFLIKPGTVYSARGVVLVEISEASELSFVLHDPYGGDTQLGEAFDLIDFGPFSACCGECCGDRDGDCCCHGHEHGCEHSHCGEHEHCQERGHDDRSAVKLAVCPQFTASGIRLDDPMHIYCERFGSFLIYTCVEGEASLQTASEDGKRTEQCVLRRGETVLVPAEVPDFFIVPRDKDTFLIETGLSDVEDDSEECCGHGDCGHDHEGCDHDCGEHFGDEPEDDDFGVDAGWSPHIYN